MVISRIIDWFKTSLPGIIILGALGSIFALFVLKLAKWLFHSFILDILLRFVTPVVKPYVIHRSLTQRYLKEDKTQLFIFILWTLASFIINSVLFFITAGVTVLYLAVVGIHLSFTSLILITLAFLFLILWLREAFASTGIWSVMLKADLEDEWKVFKKVSQSAIFASAHEGKSPTSNKSLHRTRR